MAGISYTRFAFNGLLMVALWFAACSADPISGIALSIM